MTPPRKDGARRVIGFDHPDDFHRAREVFNAASFTEAALREALGVADLLDTGPLDDPPALRRLREETPLHSLVRLFYIGVPISVAAATKALHPMTLDEWRAAGLVTLSETDVVPMVRVVPYRGLLLAADLRARMRTGASADFVLGVSKSSSLLSHTSLKSAMGRTLDVGTGCGVLALLASAHSGEVWATDKNARAVDFTRFNAQLNGITNVRCATGDLFEPVGDLRFDLVISNPPYVLAPTARYLFSDSGVRGDDFCRRLLRLGATYLEEGGYCQVMGNWAQSRGQSWHDPLEEWFEGTGCDVLVWGAESQEASGYATTWIQQTEPGYLERFPALYDAWMSYYDREGIEAVTYGLITMRRSSGRNWVRFVKVPKGSAAPTGEHILQRFAAQDYLGTVDDQQLLERSFRLADDVRIEQHYAPKDGGFAATSTRLHLARDPAYYSMELDPTVTTLVMCYRGERRLRDVFQDVAAAMRIDLEQLAPGGLPVARRLVENGFLLPTSS